MYLIVIEATMNTKWRNCLYVFDGVLNCLLVPATSLCLLGSRNESQNKCHHILWKSFFGDAIEAFTIYNKSVEQTECCCIPQPTTQQNKSQHLFVFAENEKFFFKSNKFKIALPPFRFAFLIFYVNNAFYFECQCCR